MVTFKLTRIDMTRLLYSLKGEGDLTPLQLLKLSVKNGKDHDYDELKMHIVNLYVATKKF